MRRKLLSKIFYPYHFMENCIYLKDILSKIICQLYQFLLMTFNS